MRGDENRGTWVPSRLGDRVPHLVTGLEAEALREHARALLAQADALDGKTSRVATVPPRSGQCGVCGQDMTGEACEDCTRPATPYGWTKHLGEQDMLVRLDS